MARLVVFTQKEPAKVTIGGETVRICRCGLTKDPQGFCDDTHLISKDEEENATYFYDKDLNREVVDMISDDEFEEEGCGCGNHHSHNKKDDSHSCACGNHGCGCGHHH